MIKKHFLPVIVCVFLIAFLLRVSLINWTLNYGNNGDFSRYEDWARIAHVYNFADTYTTHYLSVWKLFPNNQPPGTIYILSGTYELWILAGKTIARVTHIPAGTNMWVNSALQHIFMKSPAFLTDILMGIFIYLLVSKVAGKKRGILAVSLVLFNPVIFYNSVIWGQTDSINNFFFIASLFFAFRKKTILSLLSFAASLYVKLSLLPLVPFYLVFLFYVSGKNIKRIAIGIVASLAIIVFATIPISSNPIQWLLTELPVIARGETQSITVAAFNFWFMITCAPFACSIPDVTRIFFGLPLSLWAYGIFAALSLPLIFLQIKKRKLFITIEHAFLLFSLVALLAFLFLPGMHDRYMYPFFPLFAVAVVLNKHRKVYFLILCLLSLFNLDNIVYSWNPIVFNSTTAFYHIFYGPVLRWIVSALTVIVAVWFYKKSLTEWFTLIKYPLKSAGQQGKHRLRT